MYAAVAQQHARIVTQLQARAIAWHSTTKHTTRHCKQMRASRKQQPTVFHIIESLPSQTATISSLHILFRAIRNGPDLNSCGPHKHAQRSAAHVPSHRDSMATQSATPLPTLRCNRVVFVHDFSNEAHAGCTPGIAW